MTQLLARIRNSVAILAGRPIAEAVRGSTRRTP
jgi:hypothetical protein